MGGQLIREVGAWRYCISRYKNIENNIKSGVRQARHLIIRAFGVGAF